MYYLRLFIFSKALFDAGYANMWPWSTKAVISSTSIFVAIAKNTLYGSKWPVFLLLPKIIRILRSCSMKIFCKFPTVNISKLNFWLLICISKNFISTTSKIIFSIFRVFYTLRFQIYKYCPIITNHKSMERWFIQLSYDMSLDPYDWFCDPGSHVWFHIITESYLLNYFLLWF